MDRRNKIKKMTVPEHIALADLVRNTIANFQTAHVNLCNKHGKTSRVSKNMAVALNKLRDTQAALDTEYHIVATDEDFEQYGHVYYSKK